MLICQGTWLMTSSTDAFTISRYRRHYLVSFYLFEKNCCTGSVHCHLSRLIFDKEAEMWLRAHNTHTFFIGYTLADYGFLWPNNKLSSNKIVWMASEIWLNCSKACCIFLNFVKYCTLTEHRKKKENMVRTWQIN